MSTKISTGDTVKVLRCGTAGNHMEGVTTRVVEGNEDGSDFVYVEDPTGGGLFTQYGDTTSWIIDNDNLELAEEALADWEKELLGIETKQEESAVRQFVVGDTVEAIETMSGVIRGEQYTVARVEDPEDGKRALVHTVGGDIAYAKRFKLVAEKPKARSQEIELEDVQEGDTVVAFWNLNGVEYRQKGTVAEINETGEPLTAEGNYIVHTGGASRAYSFRTPAEHIYLISRPEKPEPKPEDALDKAKTYVVNYKKADGSKLAAYYLKHVGGEWRYSTTPDVDASEDTVEGQVRHLIEGETLWEKPVEYKEPELADGTYWVTEKDVNDLCWWKVEVKDSEATWGIRGDMSDKAYADYDYLVEASKGNWHVVHTTNPFTEPTDLEKFEQAGNVGQKYKHCGMIYKLTKKGKVKVRSASKGASWYDSSHTVGSFLELVEFGDAVKI